MVQYLVLCVDRDNDLGRKAGINGPVVGREKNLDAATKLLLADPAEADGNAMFAAVKRFDDLKARYGDVEVATVTGYGKEGFESDRELSQQLDYLVETLRPAGFVIVSNGREDDQVLPLVQSRGKIISKETALVHQAETVESTYFTISNALKDPYMARIVFVIPGIILLFIFTLGQPSLRFLLLVAGGYLILKGFGIEEKIIEWWQNFSGSVSFNRPLSVILYLASLFAVTIGLFTAYVNLSAVPNEDWLVEGLSAMRSTFVFFLGAGLLFVIGRAIDALLQRQAQRIRDYFLTIVGTALFWFELDAAVIFFIDGASNYDGVIASLVIGLAVALIAFQISKTMDLRHRVTTLFMGAPVFSNDGQWLGRVTSINRDDQTISVKNPEWPDAIAFAKPRFVFKEGRVLVPRPENLPGAASA